MSLTYKNKNTKGYNLTRSRKYHMKLFTSPIYSETCRTDHLINLDDSLHRRLFLYSVLSLC